MPTDAFSWLHLTDLHYGLDCQACLWPNLRQPFLDDLTALHERCGPWDAVLFTGDLVQSGESAQFELMNHAVLAPLWERLTKLGSGDAALLAVPGNHDLYRPNPREDNPAVDVLLKPGGFQDIAAKFWDNPTGAYRRVVNDAFAAYQQWWANAPHRPQVATGALPGDFTVILERDGRSIGILGLNTAFLQLGGGDYRERLVWDAHQLQALCPEGIDLWVRRHDHCLLISHQGPDWLTPEARKHGESEVAPPGRFAAHLFGHMHETVIDYIRRGGGREPVRLLQGCSVFGMDKFGEPPKEQRAHGYGAGGIAFGEDGVVLRLWPRIATNGTGGWRYIPDHEHAVLEADEGTAPEPLTTHRPAKPQGNPQPRPDQPATLAPVVPHSTLPARRPFFGRKDDLARIGRYLSPEDRSWGVVLDGPGGIGKTALALEAAHRAPTEHFPLKLWITAKDRALYPEGERRLQDHRVDGFDAMLAELGRALARDEIPRSRPEDRPDLVRHALSAHRALLVLDNLETFNPEERRRVFELLDRLPGTCRALVTSRRRVGASFGGHSIRLDRLEREAADELLAPLGKRWPPVAHLSDQDRDRLYAETGGNPLLLTWTAGQLGLDRARCRTLDEAIGRLQEAHRRQAINEANNPLEFIFGDLLDTFTADETAVLAALVHFTQPAPLAWLLPLTDLSPMAAETALDDLRDRALLVEDEQAGTWFLPPLAARYLRRVRPEAVGETGERLAGRAYALAQENGHREYDRFPVLDAAWPQIAAALPVLIAGDNRRLQTLCGALRNFLEFTGRWDDWLALSSEAEAKALGSGDLKAAGWRTYDQGWCHRLRGAAPEVLACAERAAAHWEETGAGAREHVVAIDLRGQGHGLAKDHEAAIADLREVVELWRGLSPKSEDLAVGLASLAGALRAADQFDEAKRHYREALARARSLSYQSGVATYTGKLAELALDRGQWPQAEALAREALGLSEGIGRKEMIAGDCHYLAKALARQGRGPEGLCHAERAVAIYAELRSPDLAKAQALLDELRRP